MIPITVAHDFSRIIGYVYPSSDGLFVEFREGFEPISEDEIFQIFGDIGFLILEKNTDMAKGVTLYKKLSIKNWARVDNGGPFK